MLAIRPSTGEIVWHYQFSPGDPYDYDGTNELVLAEVAIGRQADQGADAGQPQRLLLRARPHQRQAAVGDASSRRKINWASGIDMATGRPIDTPMTAMVRKTEQMTDFIEVWPSAFGGKNWMPMSYDPERRWRTSTPSTSA